MAIHEPSKEADASVDAGEVSASFADWVRPVVPAMVRLAVRLGARADCEDVVQEALQIAWSKRNQFDPSRGTVRQWLLAITAQQVRLAHRRQRPAAALNTIADRLVSQEVDVAGDVDLARAMADLTTRQRTAIDCHYFVGLTIAETATVMGCSEGTVKSTLFDARTRLRRFLEGAQ